MIFRRLLFSTIFALLTIACQSQPVKLLTQSAQSIDDEQDFVQITTQGSHSYLEAYGDKIFFVSHGRHGVKNADIYSLSSKGIKRITFQNANIDSLKILDDQIFYFSDYRIKTLRPSSIFGGKTDGEKQLAPLKEFQMVRSNLSGSSRQTRDIKFSPIAQLNISRDGKFIAYTIEKDSKMKIVRQNLKTGRTKLFGSENIHAFNPTFQQNALVWIEHDGSSSKIMTLNGKNQPQLITQLTGEIRDLNWHSKLGLLFSYKPPNLDRHHLYSWHKGCHHHLLSFHKGIRYPASTDNGTELYFSSESDRQIYKTSLEAEFNCAEPTLVQGKKNLPQKGEDSNIVEP